MLESKSVRTASRMFYKLLQNGQLKEKDDRNLYFEYMNNSQVREVINITCEESNCKIRHISDCIYLIPNEDNDILGFNFRKNVDLRSAKNTEEFYLTLYITTVILSEFFHEVHPSAYLEVLDILDIVSERLKTASEKKDIETEENAANYNVVKLFSIWNAKPKWNESSASGITTTSMDYQLGTIRKVINFLKNQNLIVYIEDEDKIKPKERLQHLMDGHFLDKERKELIEKLFSKDSIL